MSKFQNIGPKWAVKSHWLILGMSLYFGFVLNAAFWRYIATHIEINSFSVFVFALSLPFFIAFPTYLLFNLLSAPYTTKPVLIFFTMLSSITNYLMFNLGVYIDTDMVRNVFETNTREAFDLVTFSGFLWVLLTGIIPSVLIALIKIEYKSWGKEILQRLLCVFAVLLVVGGFFAVSYKEYASFGRNNRDVRKIINTVNYTYSTVRHFQR